MAAKTKSTEGNRNYTEQYTANPWSPVIYTHQGATVRATAQFNRKPSNMACRKVRDKNRRTA